MGVVGVVGILCVIPVWVRGGKHELELYDTGVVLQLSMLNAVQLVRDVCSANVHLGVIGDKGTENALSAEGTEAKSERSLTSSFLSPQGQPS